MQPLTLISHPLCPYVQRAAIALIEKNLAFERVDIDLARKPRWFLDISPLGKTPVLKVGETPIFESAVILEYLEETTGSPLHPADALDRARHRGWMEFGSAILNDIAGFYSAADETAFLLKVDALRAKFGTIEHALAKGPYFAGVTFSLVDAVFAPVFRYFDVFDGIGDFDVIGAGSGVSRWRNALADRPSTARGAPADYAERLTTFLRNRQSYLSRLMGVPT